VRVRAGVRLRDEVEVQSKFRIIDVADKGTSVVVTPRAKCDLVLDNGCGVK
jgi:hypothetical protein